MPRSTNNRLVPFALATLSSHVQDQTRAGLRGDRRAAGFMFSQRCDEMAGKFGLGFVLTDAVKKTIRRNQPID